MPFVNVIRGERIDSAPLNVRTPIVRLPIWLVLAWWLVKGLARLVVLYVRFWYVTVPVSVLWWLYLRFGWLGLALVVIVPAVALTVWALWHRASFLRVAGFPAVSRWRRWWYRRRWVPAMTTARLVVAFDGHTVVPVLRRVHSTGTADVLTVRMVTGQIPDDFARVSASG